MTAEPEGPTLAELAALIGGRAAGDVEMRVTGVATLDNASPSELGLLTARKYLRRLPYTRAGALLVSEELDADVGDGRSRVVVDDPRASLVTLLDHLHPPPPRRVGVHETAVVEEGARLGVEACIGPYVVIDADVTIGDRATLHSHVVIGRGASLGNDVTLHPHVVLYPGARLGDRVILHAGVRIGVDGFGYSPSPDGLQKIPHVGSCEIGDDVEVGANSCVDRGSIGRTRLGRDTKLDNLVHIAHNVSVGDGSVMAAQVGVAGSTTIGKGTMWGGQAGAADHIDIGDGARIAGQAGLTEDVAPSSTMVGFPARPRIEYLRAQAGLYRLAALRRRVREMERLLAASGDADEDE